MTTSLAVDLGGTRLKAATLSSGGPRAVEACEHDGDWRRALRDVVARHDADEVALCVPGLVEDGRVVALPGKLPGIEGVDLAAAVGVRVPVVVNDAIAYGIGEAQRGAGRGFARVLVVTLGTGVGVAVLEDGLPLGRGRLGGGLLGGQLPIGGRGLDTSGRTGTFEALCRADALVAAVPGATDVQGAYAAVSAGDPAAVHGFSTYRADLVRGLTALCLAHAPECVVVGGGASRPVLLEGVEQAVLDGLWAGQTTTVRPAELGDAAALHGLAVLLQAQVTA